MSPTSNWRNSLSSSAHDLPENAPYATSITGHALPIFHSHPT